MISIYKQQSQYCTEIKRSENKINIYCPNTIQNQNNNEITKYNIAEFLHPNNTRNNKELIL